MGTENDAATFLQTSLHQRNGPLNSVKQYAAFLLERVQPSSASSALSHLRLALRAIAPDVSWAWMRPIQRRFDFRTVARDKRGKMVHASVLIQLGENLIEKSQFQGAVHDPLAFRDGLLAVRLLQS